ncbi:hypothetical protein KUH03_16190 [Sphingobacterium sp. E70]|uniref:hypothetical protein n=1 Tax=Sphingobacterium sp. E70 TaxID=2853439 RepID=UPI00211CD10E|nr:hypothetical protein [Sphingobacterium sp. E70]ULT28002.1 hypothetical protein KUH03_16190 [Sphingobacterium sp. E70]
MLTAHFTAIDKAGKASAYDNSSATYKAAIDNFDKQVGEILKALEQRATFKKENWLVIITSSKGGPFEIPPAQNDNTIFSNPNVNTFTIFYSRNTIRVTLINLIWEAVFLVIFYGLRVGYLLR